MREHEHERSKQQEEREDGEVKELTRSVLLRRFAREMETKSHRDELNALGVRRPDVDAARDPQQTCLFAALNSGFWFCVRLLRAASTRLLRVVSTLRQVSSCSCSDLALHTQSGRVASLVHNNANAAHGPQSSNRVVGDDEAT